MGKIAYIDFDGTIVDILPRYYGILSEYIHNKYLLSLSYQQYCIFKRQGLRDHIIVKECFSGLNIDIGKYTQYKHLNLENDQWLKKDKVILYPKTAYKIFKELGYSVVLLSLRNHKERLLDQIQYLGLNNAFDNFVVLRPVPNQNAKLLYLTNKINTQDLIVGDSPIEMECAKRLSIEGYFVESGLWGRQFANNQNLVFKNYNSVTEYLLNSKRGI